MALSYGQRKAYVDTLNIYRLRQQDADRTTGQVPDDVWDLKYSAVPAAWIPTPNNTSPAGALGLIQEETLLTEDRLECEYSVDLRSGDVIRCTTAGTKRYGKLWTLMGDPQELDQLANCQEARLRQQPHCNALMPDAASFPGVD